MIVEFVNDQKYYYCEHDGQKGHPYVAIPVDDKSNIIVLCRQCRGTALGIILSELLMDGLKKMEPLTPEQIATITDFLKSEDEK
jgi:hypothetical protein